MTKQKYFLSVACLLFFGLMASISLAAAPVGQLPDQSMPAMKDALTQTTAALVQSNTALAQCNSNLAQCNTDLAQSQAHPRFTVLNPRASRPPIIAVPPSPRLSTLTGKIIAVVANYDRTMAPLATAFAQAGYNVLFISDLPVAQGQTPRPIQLNVPGVTNMSLVDFEKNPKQASAIIVGNGF